MIPHVYATSTEKPKGSHVRKVVEVMGGSLDRFTPEETRTATVQRTPNLASDCEIMLSKEDGIMEYIEEKMCLRAHL